MIDKNKCGSINDHQHKMSIADEVSYISKEAFNYFKNRPVFTQAQVSEIIDFVIDNAISYFERMMDDPFTDDERKIFKKEIYDA